MEDFYPSKNHGPDSGIGSDNGDKRLSTTEVRVQTSVTHVTSLTDLCLPVLEPQAELYFSETRSHQ